MKYVILVFILLTLTTLKSEAHDWYPSECCGGMDCAPVDSWSITKSPDPKQLGQLVVTTKHGTINIPPDFSKRESKDAQMHVCMRKDGPSEIMKLICVFIPPGM